MRMACASASVLMVIVMGGIISLDR